MKKILTALLAVAMLLGCVAIFASCGNQGPKPKMNLEDAADALEDEDYEVYHVDDEDDISTPGMVESLSARDGDNYLYVAVFEKAETAKLYYEQLKLEYEQEIEAIKLDIKYYEHIIKKYDDDLDSDDIDDYEDMIKDLEDELEDMKDEYCFGRSGKTVWYGTEDAIKDSKK